jgi:hypothetical protein
MTHEATTIKQAILDSIRENRTVEIEAVLDSENWVRLAEALSAECDDYSEEAGEIGATRLYSGVDDDDDKWQIRLVGSAIEYDYTIKTDADMCTISATTMDEAARKWAASEAISGVTDVASLFAHIESIDGAWMWIESDDAPDGLRQQAGRF